MIIEIVTGIVIGYIAVEILIAISKELLRVVEANEIEKNYKRKGGRK